MPRLSKKKSVWFDMPNDPDKGRVQITHMSNTTRAAIRKEVVTTRQVINPVSKKFEQETLVDEVLDRQLTINAVVTDWENFLDQDGESMKCNRKNKFIWACDDKFMAQINMFRAEVAKVVEEEEEEARKNS